MLISVPYFRLHKDFCSFIARYFKNVSIIKDSKHFDSNQTIYIIGQKDTHRVIDGEIYDRLRRCCNPDNIPSADSDINHYDLPIEKGQLSIFKGSMIDENELLNIAKNSGCMNDFFNEQKVSKLSDSSIKPLLPFNIGQIGLVLTSGCLDGVIDEGDGYCHLVKGRVVKTEDCVREVVDGEVQEKVTHSNKVEINVLMPNGDYKTLA